MSFVSRSYHSPRFLKEREIWVLHGMFMPGMVKREREKSHAGHVSRTRIGIVIPGTKMDEMSCKKRTKE